MFRELTIVEIRDVAGGQGGSQQICQGAGGLAAGIAASQGVPLGQAGLLGYAVTSICNSLTSGGAPGGDTAGYGNGSADGNGGGGQVGGDGA